MIRAQAHFIWFGSDLPWIYGLAIRSVALRGELDRVVLHHADSLAGTAGWRLALQTSGVEARLLSPEAVLEAAQPWGPRLVDLYRRLAQPAARANMLQVLVA